MHYVNFHRVCDMFLTTKTLNSNKTNLQNIHTDRSEIRSSRNVKKES